MNFFLTKCQKHFKNGLFCLIFKGQKQDGCQFGSTDIKNILGTYVIKVPNRGQPFNSWTSLVFGSLLY